MAETNTTASTRIKSFVERVERIEHDKAALELDINEVFAEAKGEGFDVKLLKAVIARRRKDKAQLAEEDALLKLYTDAAEGRA